VVLDLNNLEKLLNDLQTERNELIKEHLKEYRDSLEGWMGGGMVVKPNYMLRYLAAQIQLVKELIELLDKGSN
jgi:hypothetical protein